MKYEFRYEPWVVADRLLVPWYDARFRGYGQNKIVHLEHLNSSGFRWVGFIDLKLILNYWGAEPVLERLSISRSWRRCNFLNEK